jgi:uncharacterized membrane protein
MMRFPSPARVFFVSSLALNVFLGTVLLVRHWPPGPPGPPSPSRLAEKIAETLPPADGVILRAAVAAHQAEIEAGFKGFHATPDRVRAVLAAPQFDPEALRPIFAEGRAAHDRADQALAEMLIEASSQMSPEGRAALARWHPPHPPGERPPPPGLFGPGGPPPPPGDRP